MYKKILALILAVFMLFVLVGCGGAPSEGEAAQSAEDGQANVAAEESAPSFSVPTQADPPAVYQGINMVNLVPEGCTEVIYNEGVYLYKFSSQPTGEMLVNFINELLIPELEAKSDNGVCLVKDPNGKDPLGLGTSVTSYHAFDSFGYTVSNGNEYAYFVIDGEQFGSERHLQGNSMLLDTRYVYDGVLYDAITRVNFDQQAISVTLFEEPSQNFEIIE